ncbi:ribulose-5-phosphate 4-epimerase/fuculose-1-phosphate aldolase [Paraburkholderia sp. JPY465]|uniref:class II aldolase/adducin family protein n=1 Tax=Paraburkholderia sp. JPY465 TaxID=3042285 RepID=UPI003D1BA15E
MTYQSAKQFLGPERERLVVPRGDDRAMSPEEWETRVALAACYRAAVLYRWTDHIYTHFSARIRGAEEHYLVNAYGQTFDEVTASSLVKLDLDGNIISDPTGLGVNAAGFVIHSAIHRARPDLHCVLHTHTPAGVGVSAQKNGLLMITQHAMRYQGRIGYHDYEGFALDLGEQARLVKDLGPHRVLILRNHGLLACGESIPRAFQELHFIERACAAQISAQAGGASLSVPPAEIAERVAEHIEKSSGGFRTQRHWDAVLRQLDRIDSSYRQ